ncbi:hypothetical protein [Corynebacterium lubricantis]|uniref:hypothetical protein n=1 Tax=Corynebacterium lubricantis TaxID=541095 RepID=UPI0003761EAE|nr:hypothetical protein [Corynebacterium lubricantis]
MTPIAEWISAELDAGRDDLQTMLDTSPYPRPAVRTIAEAGNFAIENGRVVRADGPSWFVADSDLVNRENGVYALDVSVPDPNATLEMPLALINVLAVPRLGRVVLKSATGAKLVSFVNTPRVGPIATLIDDTPGNYTLVFDAKNLHLSVENQGGSAPVV